MTRRLTGDVGRNPTPALAGSRRPGGGQRAARSAASGRSDEGGWHFWPLYLLSPTRVRPLPLPGGLPSVGVARLPRRVSRQHDFVTCPAEESAPGPGALRPPTRCRRPQSHTPTKALRARAGVNGLHWADLGNLRQPCSITYGTGGGRGNAATRDRLSAMRLSVQDGVRLFVFYPRSRAARSAVSRSMSCAPWVETLEAARASARVRPAPDSNRCRWHGGRRGVSRSTLGRRDAKRARQVAARHRQPRLAAKEAGSVNLALTAAAAGQEGDGEQTPPSEDQGDKEERWMVRHQPGGQPGAAASST